MNEDKNPQQLEKDLKLMIFIAHDFFHRWREVIGKKYGQEEREALTTQFWKLVGKGTGEAYLKRGKERGDLAGIVNSIVRVSQVMGETARAVQDGDDYLLIHDACPWIESYQTNGFPGQCQAGCDAWFKSAAATISTDITIQTESCLAGGDQSCIRRFKQK